jgi:hypothetical protein
MELKQVNLINVRNFDNKTFNFEGNTEIVMPNEGGKSTLADAITFVLIGKLYSGASDAQSLKPLRDTAEEVSIELIYSDGEKELSLKKTYKENWVKTRGTTEVTMSGHTTDCFINETKMTVSNFEKELCGYFNVQSTKELNIMLNPYYFGQVMSWQERLEYVTKVTGEVTIDDVIDVAKEVKPLRDDLYRYGDGLKQKLHTDTVEKKKAVEEKQIQIKGDVIEEVVTEKTFNEAATLLNSNNDKILKLRVKKQGINDPVLEALKVQKMEVSSKIEQSKDADRQELAKKNESINKNIELKRVEKLAKQELVGNLRNEINANDNSIRSTKEEIQRTDKLISKKRAELAEVKEDYNKMKATEFKPLESKHCPNCDFDLTAEENEKLKSEFNLNQAKELKNITNKGNQLVEEINSLKKEINDANDKIANLEFEQENKRSELKLIEEKVVELSKDILELENSKTYNYVSELTKSLQKQLEGILDNITQEENKTFDSEGIQSEISELETANVKLQETIDEYNAQKRLKVRKEQRERELVRLEEQLADAEFKEELLAIYNKTYLRILNERVEHHFPGVKFQLIKDNIKEGSWSQVCYVLVESEKGLLVPYETANTASKIKIGVKIASLLADALGWNKLPMVIDNAEAVTKSNRYFDTDAQVITLVADDLTSDKIPPMNNEQQAQLTLEI